MEVRMSSITSSATPAQRVGRAALRGWACAGIVAVVGGVGGIAFFDTERSMANQDVRLRLCAAFGMIGVAALVVFAAGLRRSLEEQLPVESQLGRIAQAGCMITAGTLFVGYLLKLVAAGYTHQITGAANVVARNGLDELSTGAWAALALTMAAVAFAGVRHAALPRWLGWVSAVAGVFVAAVSVAGATAGAYLPAVAWLLLVSLALLRERTA
jgi:hypothetical protein